MDAFTKACHWLIADELMVGPHPGHALRSTTLRRYGYLIDCGIRLFIDLSESGEKAYPGVDASCQALAHQTALEKKVLIRFEHLPFPSDGCPDEPALLSLLATMQQAREQHRGICLHATPLDARPLLLFLCHMATMDGTFTEYSKNAELLGKDVVFTTDQWELLQRI